MGRPGVVDIVSQIKADEGFRGSPYRDSLGNWTIGYGTLLPHYEPSIQTHVEWTPERAEQELQIKLNAVNIGLADNLPWVWDLGVVKRGVFQNMGYNMGIERLLGFTNTLAAAKASDWERCKSEMLKSKWATQVGARAERLAKQVVTCEWQ